MQMSRGIHAQVAWQHGGPQAVPVRATRAKRQHTRTVQVMAYAAVPATVLEQPSQAMQLQPLPRNVENVADDPRWVPSVWMDFVWNGRTS
jgi:hypothetical protein